MLRPPENFNSGCKTVERDRSRPQWNYVTICVDRKSLTVFKEIIDPIKHYSSQTFHPPPTIHNLVCFRQTDYESCASWVKYAIYGCNIVFLVVGAITLAVGAWLRTDSRFREFLSERYRNVVEEAFWQAPTLYIFSYVIIILGASMIVVSSLGCCGTVTQSRVLLIVYAIVTSLLMLGTLATGIYAIYKRDGIDVEVSDALTYMVQHYYQGAGVVQESLDRLQQTFRCCGNAGCSDFKVFRQDVPRTCDIRCDGCHYRIMMALRIGFSVGFIVFLLVVLLQVYFYFSFEFFVNASFNKIFG
uniref:Tetraspanin n=1 Tax=Syphacia muris TaxID=451379 RepID=A0A0N5AJX2_9BILA